MKLTELLKRKIYLERKLENLNSHVIRLVASGDTGEDTQKKLLESMELYSLLVVESQDLSLKICNVRVITKVAIGETEISMINAMVVRDAMKRKADFVEGLIINNDCSIDVVDFIKKQDGYYNDWLTLDQAITNTERSTEID